MSDPTGTTEQTIRPLREIAAEIRETWPKVNFAAVPYLEAMERLDGINDSYFQDSARGIVQYFLANATHYRGEDAKRIKAELKAQLALPRA